LAKRSLPEGAACYRFLKEVMARIGHSSTWAVMIYQHATGDRDRAIAGALDVLIVTARSGRV
jgi:hypothetical protein